MNWLKLPAGMVRYDDLFNLLVALWLSGGADEFTLNLVAQSYGLLDMFEQAKLHRRSTLTALSIPVLPQQVQP